MWPYADLTKVTKLDIDDCNTHVLPIMHHNTHIATCASHNASQHMCFP